MQIGRIRVSMVNDYVHYKEHFGMFKKEVLSL